MPRALVKQLDSAGMPAALGDRDMTVVRSTVQGFADRFAELAAASPGHLPSPSRTAS
jgi:hypothetical protein